MSQGNQTATAAEGRRLVTPTREALLEHFARLDDLSKTVLGIEMVTIVGVLAWFLSKGSLPSSPGPWIACAIGGLGVFRWMLYHIFLNKKRLDEIRPDAQFGIHTRDSLLRLAREVFGRLGIELNSVPVFLTRSKDVNAQAVRCELWPGKRLFNGVFLNRSIIHLLDERELASVIGHELGHVLPYAPLLSRSYMVHSLFAGVLSFFIASFFKHAGVALFVPFVILFILDWVIAYPHSALSRGTEFLCDDYGARAAGLLPALSCEMKLGAESETRQNLPLRLFEARSSGASVKLADLFEVYEEAVPFGKADPKVFEQEFSKLVADRRTSAGKISLGGFLQDVFGREDSTHDDWANQQIEELKLLSALPLIQVERDLYLQGSHSWSIELARQLADSIESQPDRLLFQSACEIDDSASSHPNTSRRILFLWRNREQYVP